MGKRLGYRFVVENVEILSEKENRMWKMGEDSSGQMSLMRITLENHGFAGLTEEADCFLEIEEENKKPEKYRIHTDARAWHSGDTTILCRQIKLPAVAEPKKMFLALYRRRDGRPLLFANQNAESGRVFLGTYQSNFSSFSVPSRNP